MATSQQFSDPRLVAAYDALNAHGDDAVFWLNEVERLAPRTIIDFGCGTGLLTCELAKRGYTTIGIDPAGAMLNIARRKPHAESVQWLEGSYERLGGLGADLVLMTSHVAQFFLDETEWHAMLKAALQALAPAGHIVFDSRTPIFPPFPTWPTEGAPARVQDPAVGSIDWWYTPLEVKDSRVRYQISYHFIGSNETVVSADELIFRSREALTTSLQAAGFTIDMVYGNWDRSPATPESPEMIFVASTHAE